MEKKKILIIGGGFGGIRAALDLDKKLSKKEARAYIGKVNSLDKAGAYAIQMKPKIVTKIKGSRSNVIGLPEEVVRKILSRK